MTLSRRGRILRNIGAGLVALILIAGIGAILTVQTQWFRDFVRRKIITATEEGTGGKVEVGSFSFDWRALEAVVSGFVIHGKEPPGALPFVRVARAQVNLRLFTSLRRVIDVSFLGVERPEANILVLADGTTNIPQPAEKPKSNTTILDTVVDLAVDYFRVSDGLLTFNSKKQSVNLSAHNLRAQLWFNLVTRSYKGQLSLQPIYVASGRNTPVVFTVNLPITLERTRVALDGAKITTPASQITINGALEDLNNPKTNARVDGYIALVDLKNLGDVPLDLNGRNLPSVINLNGNAAIAGDRITVSEFRVGVGKSSIVASGILKDPQGNGALNFKSSLALDELGQMANSTAHPGGIAVANGQVKLDASNNYRVTGTVEGRDLSFSEGNQRIRNVGVVAGISLDPHRLDVKGLRISALGGQITGDASLEEFARYNFSGNLGNFNLQTISQALGQKSLAYSGVISGPIQAEGDLKAPGTKSIKASAKLAIAPGRLGIPVSGRINAEYNGATDNINVPDSYVALPNSRLNLSGSLNNRLDVELTTRNVNELLAGSPSGSDPHITINGGQARFAGAVTGKLAAPNISGHLAVDSFSVQGRRFDSLAADLAAAKNRASVSNGVLLRGPMQAHFNASAGLLDWSPKPNQPVTANVNIQNGDLADVMVLADQPPGGYSGALTLDGNVGGTIGNPSGAVNLQVVNGTVKKQPFDRLQAKVNLSDQLITIPAASMSSGTAQVNLAAEFRHPRDSFSTGQLHAHVQSNQVNLAEIRPLQQQRPNTAGTLNLTADVTGDVTQRNVKGKDETEFLLSSVNLDGGARNLQFEGQNYGDVTAKATTTGQTVAYNLHSNFAGSAIQMNGSTRLVRDYPTTADANIRNLPIERLLVLAKRTDIPARGNLSGTAHVSGTMSNPEGSADLDLANAVLYEEPIDHVRTRVSYQSERIDIPSFEVDSGPSRINLAARYDHRSGDLNAGDLTFRVNSSRIELGRIRNVQKIRPGLAGSLQITSSGAAKVQEGEPRLLVRDFNADIGATGIAAQGTKFGDLTLKAASNAGRLNFSLNSNLAGASVQGQGTAQLSGDYPVNAEMKFSNVLWSRLQPLLGPSTGEPPSFDAAAEGQVTLNGPVTKTDQLNGSLQITQLQFKSLPEPGANEKPIVVSNQGPIAATMYRGTVRIDSAHLAGPQTDINATGTVSLVQTQQLNLNLNAKTDLGLLRNFSQDIYSSGNIVLASTVRGTLQKPLVNGQLELKNASINHVDFPNGISNANGQVIFNGNTATIKSMTAETGGGKLALSGFISLGDTLRLGLRATANQVRVRTQQGVSVVANAAINVTGTPQSSLAAGTVVITQLTYAPQSDIGSILTASTPPPAEAPASSNPLLQNLRLDIRVRTSRAATVQASVAQNVQVDADLHVRGTAVIPGVQGTATVTEGNLVFFGSQYRVSSGIISFYNPVRIEPILNITLETQAKGVDVVLTVTGPIDNMKLSYTSDPPLQFQEIVALLASGKTPTSDPTLLANQPSAPQQTYEQMGESAIVGKALADPVASRLQRVFGVSQLKIDPSFTSGSDLPQARVTLQQQIANNLTFTYVTALDDPNTQIIRIEWAFSPRWSALANRDENGIFSINFLYKKQFR